MKPIALVALSFLILASTGAIADGSDHSFFVCNGISQKNSAEAFSFTVTLDMRNEKVINIGSGDVATTETFTDKENIGKHDLGGGVINKLTVDRDSRTFILIIMRTDSSANGGNDIVNDDEFRGACKPAGKAF